MSYDMYTLPCRSVTSNPKLAAELWAEAFYQAKDALANLRAALEVIAEGKPVRNLDEIYLACDAVQNLGE